MVFLNQSSYYLVGYSFTLYGFILYNISTAASILAVAQIWHLQGSKYVVKPK